MGVPSHPGRNDQVKANETMEQMGSSRLGTRIRDGVLICDRDQYRRSLRGVLAEADLKTAGPVRTRASADSRSKRLVVVVTIG